MTVQCGVTYEYYKVRTIFRIGSEQAYQATHRLHVRRWDEATLAFRITLWLNFPPAICGQLCIERGTRDALVIRFLDEQEQLILLDFDFIFGLGRVVE